MIDCFISNLKKLFKILIIFLAFVEINSQALHPSDNNIPLQSKDTLCYHLSFEAGDTLIYNVLSYDSISINFDKPLKRIRLEKIKVICENIDSDNRFELSIELIDFKSKEAYKDIKEKEVNQSAWQNRKVNITIDRLGDRYFSKDLDTSEYAISPGGSFAPTLFFPFLRQCKEVNSTWIVQSTDTLVENGNPIPLMKQVSLFRLHPPVDTFGVKCAKLEYVKTGQGVVNTYQAGKSINVTSRVSGYGEYYLSLEQNIPIYYFATVEQKLTIHLPNGMEQPGEHKLSSYYTLESISKAKNNKNIKKN